MQNPSVIPADDSSPFKGAEKAVAPAEHYNAIAGRMAVNVKYYPPDIRFLPSLKGNSPVR